MKQILQNGLKGLCPKCGKSSIFLKWSHLKEKCENCGLVLQAREDDTWFFMYMSAGGITALFIISFFFFTPSNFIVGRIVVGILALVLFFASNRFRKGLAIAFDYWTDTKSEFPKFPV